MNKMIRSFGIVIAMAAMAGCAANVSRPSSPTDATAELDLAVPAAISRLVVVLVPASGIALDENWTAFRDEWRSSLANAAGQGRLDTVLLDHEPDTLAASDLLARVEVRDYRYVSQARRFGLGVMSGNAHMDVTVHFQAPPDRRAIGSRDFQTSSQAMQGVFSAMTPRQVQAVVDEIVREATPR